MVFRDYRLEAWIDEVARHLAGLRPAPADLTLAQIARRIREG